MMLMCLFHPSNTLCVYKDLVLLSTLPLLPRQCQYSMHAVEQIRAVDVVYVIGWVCAGPGTRSYPRRQGACPWLYDAFARDTLRVYSTAGVVSTQHHLYLHLVSPINEEVHLVLLKM